MSGELEQEKLSDLPPAMRNAPPTAVLERPTDEAMPPEATAYVASQWQLMWWKFRKHRLAMIGGIVTILIYLIAILVEFLTPYDPNRPLC